MFSVFLFSKDSGIALNLQYHLLLMMRPDFDSDVLDLRNAQSSSMQWARLSAFMVPQKVGDITNVLLENAAEQRELASDVFTHAHRGQVG